MPPDKSQIREYLDALRGREFYRSLPSDVGSKRRLDFPSYQALGELLRERLEGDGYTWTLEGARYHAHEIRAIVAESTEPWPIMFGVDSDRTLDGGWDEPQDVEVVVASDAHEGDIEAALEEVVNSLWESELLGSVSEAMAPLTWNAAPLLVNEDHALACPVCERIWPVSSGHEACPHCAFSGECEPRLDEDPEDGQ